MKRFRIESHAIQRRWGFAVLASHARRVILQLFPFCLILFLPAIMATALAAEPRVQILSPKEGDRITQEKDLIFVSGKVARDAGRASKVDIFLLVDISGSTAQYSGTDLGDAGDLPDNSGFSGFPTPQISIGGMPIGRPPMRNLRNSVLAAEVAAARRLLAQLNPESTRVGVLTFSEGARVLQPLSGDFDRVRRTLDDILRGGAFGGTNMVEGIRLGITELLGLGASEKRTDAVKVQIMLTDGFPTLPIGGSKQPTQEDTDFAINAARLAGRAGIKVHVFALGEDALSYPRAAVGIAKESGGTYTPIIRPADALAVVENTSVIGIDQVQVVNRTTGQKATQLRLAADGFFSSALPVAEGRNQIDVFARASDGSNANHSITVYYQPGKQKSLDLEVFLDKEKKLDLEIKRLGRTQEEIQKDVERNREQGLSRPAQSPPPAKDGPPQ
jgi:Mg-chelatase subunit ChlD